MEVWSGVCHFEGLHSKLDSGTLTLLMQLELQQHLNDGSASEESEMKEKAIKRYCTISLCKDWKVITENSINICRLIKYEYMTKRIVIVVCK